MNKRKAKKNRRKIILYLLNQRVKDLEQKITGNQKVLDFSFEIIHNYQATVKVIFPYSDNHNIRIEIRQAEANHFVPHFHIKVRGDGEGSYRIEDLRCIVSDISSQKERTILQWAKENRSILVDTWNEFHGYRIIAR